MANGLYKMNELTEKQYEMLGNRIISFLYLAKNENKRIDTTWGDKTPIGLGKCIHRMLKESYQNENI